MGYPLVPGYETVGEVVEAGARSGRKVGDRVFVPGANCFGAVRSLFGGAASRLVVPGARVAPLHDGLGMDATLYALAATAAHALLDRATGQHLFPDVIVGHGILGRLIARITIALGGPPPTVWETREERRTGAAGYDVVDPQSVTRSDHARIIDASGSVDAIDSMVARLRSQGEIVLAGFYSKPVSFAFPPAFIREATFRISAEWRPGDLDLIQSLVGAGKLDLSGLITHCAPVSHARSAYEQAFVDAGCLKMVLDWRTLS
jgi:3-hydroxyethyl bacteriochlorophyllide a dehydrogenase